eukprot:TRINITY_DN807_c0_g1_i1.p1 TRINITY_DN807_c0_g1~~TRINITY_DN807_c0_g1_i1.p1  ORF type:complete len:285 (+),score=88.64 TRINITY_DN807_c0_g1_i1:163-1017(+)
MSRPTSHAGSWYPNDPQRLKSMIEQYLEVDYRTNLKAIICPHAGFIYSAPCAGHSFGQVDPNAFDNICIIGPSHRAYVSAAVSMFDEYETPLGSMRLNKEIVDKLLESPHFSPLSTDADITEHCLELQLPFLAYIFKERLDSVKIIPILLGDVKPRLLAPALLEVLDERTLVVISSDFCHYGARNFDFAPKPKNNQKVFELIENLDRQGIDLICDNDFRGFKEYLGKTGNTICGKIPILLLLALFELKYPKVRGELLDYQQSSRIQKYSFNESSVSYAAVSFSL